MTKSPAKPFSPNAGLLEHAIFFLGIPSESGRDFLKTTVWGYSYESILYSLLHRCQTCIMLSSHKSPLTFYMYFFQKISCTYNPILMPASQRTQLLIFFGKYLERELFDHIISQVGFSEKGSIFGIKVPVSFIKYSLLLMGYTAINPGHRAIGMAARKVGDSFWVGHFFIWVK